MPLVNGSDLKPAAKRQALARFVHRYTKTHRPAWANQPRPDGAHYPVQFADDADWLANTEFAVTLSGSLDMRVNYCQSRPTWPDNPDLRRHAGISILPAHVSA